MAYASGTTLYALLGLAACRIAAPSILSVGFVALLAALALFTTLIMVTLRTPSLQEVAKLVDHTYQLQQRCETALEFLSHHDAFSLLLHRDAYRHLQRIDPARLLPYSVSDGAKMFLLVALIVGGLTAGLRFTGFWHEGLGVVVRLLSPPATERQQVREMLPETMSTTTRLTPQQTRTAVTAEPSRTVVGSQPAAPSSTTRRLPANPVAAASTAVGLAPDIAPAVNTTRADRIPEGDQDHRHAVRRKLKNTASTALSRRDLLQIAAPHSGTHSIPRQTGSGTRQSQIGAAAPRGNSGQQHATAQTMPDQPGPAVTVNNNRADSRTLVSPTSNSRSTPSRRRDVPAHAAPQHTAERRNSPHPSPSLNRPDSLSGQSPEAMEKPLARNSIPPGFWRYIRDYFVAIHSERKEAWRP